MSGTLYSVTSANLLEPRGTLSFSLGLSRKLVISRMSRPSSFD